jgi:hypothetical protein
MNTGPSSNCWVVLIALARLLGDPSALTPANSGYEIRTVQEILKAASRMDGARVEVRGKIRSGFETSIFGDDSTPRCIWLKFERSKCAVVNGKRPGEGCLELLDRLSKPLPAASGGSTLFELDHIIVRGVVLTVRRDIKYSKSLPKSVRVGFGHLGAYPAEVRVEEVEMENLP